MTMKQLATTFLAILFAVYGTVSVDGMKMKDEGGSNTTTLQPILLLVNNSVHFQEGNDLVGRVKRLKEEFSKYETKVTGFVSSMNRVLTSFYFDKADNLVELTNYLPSAEKTSSRRKCHCEGIMREPCPQRCINSCFVSNGFHYDDCRYVDVGDHYNHYCYEGASKITDRDISQCYDPPTAKPCSEFAVNQTNLKESFLNFAKLLVEPARIKVRGVQRNLKFVRESIRSMDTLSDISWQHCRDPQNMLCFPGATELIETKVKYYELLAKNITKDLIDTQNEVDRIEGNVHVLTEGVIKQINDATKNYSCCLKGLNFQVEGVDCAIPTTEATVQATPLAPMSPQTMFRCDNGELITMSWRCDGDVDCADASDETHCHGN